MKKKYKIVNKKRFFLSSTLFLSFSLILIASVLFKTIAYSSKQEAKYIEVKIEEGDTLWAIVSKYIPDTINKQRTVFKITKLNNIGNRHIYPGDIIKIPIE